MDTIKKFKPFARALILVFLSSTVVTLCAAINIIAFRKPAFNKGALNIFNMAAIAFFAILFFDIIKEIKHIYRIYIEHNKSNLLNNIDMDNIMRNKFKFINDAEMVAKNNPEKKFALLHFDINRFTVINNSVGYKVGDTILQQMAQTLLENLKNQIIGKGEGDNFFVLHEYVDQDEVIETAIMIPKKIESLNIWGRIRVNPTIKTGIVFLSNDDLDIRSAIDKAFVAKKVLKNSYKSEYVIYKEEISSSLIEANRIVDDMHEALEKKEFKVYYQPKVDLRTGLITGAEALVRWEHPELGLLSPDKFIPIFEQNGFIIKLDKYVLEEVCSNMRSWMDSGNIAIPVSVNVSRVHFLISNFAADYNEIKEKYNIDNEMLEIEITESIAFSNDSVREVFSVMKEFKDFGFRISIDDFGSGYSCLGLLKEMPIDTLKLDRMFLNNIEEHNSQVIVSNIVNMAKDLNLNVVSEGVENYMQAEFLRDIGCDTAQGFVFARPEPVNSFLKLIKVDIGNNICLS
jgi:diguanylate cyclase (GGDEF)-like protein